MRKNKIETLGIKVNVWSIFVCIFILSIVPFLILAIQVNWMLALIPLPFIACSMYLLFKYSKKLIKEIYK